MLALTRLCHSHVRDMPKLMHFWSNPGLKVESNPFRKQLLRWQRERHHMIRRNPLNDTKKPFAIVRLSLGLLTASGIKLWPCNILVHCDIQEPNLTVISSKSENVEDPKFDWRKFMVMLWPHLWHLVAAIGAALIVALLNIQIPLVLGDVINVLAKLVQNGALKQTTLVQQLRKPASLLLYMYTSQAFFTFLYIYLLSCVGERIATSMKQELFASVMRQDIAFFDHHRTGDIVNRLTVDVQDFKSAFKLCISQGLRSVTQIIGCTVSLFVISPHMAGSMLLVVPTVVVTGTLIGSFLRKMSRAVQEQTSKATAVSEEAISSIRTVRAFAMEDTECKIFNEQTEEVCRLNENLGFGIGLFQGGTNLFLNGMVLGTLYGGSCLMVKNQISAGDMMAFLVATQTIQRSLSQLSLLFGHVIKGLAAGARVFQFINQEPSMPILGGKKIPYHSFIANVAFHNVTFAYPSRPQEKVLKNFNLHLPPGKTVAIVGSSGNGKSTIATLLERFYDVDKGYITIDNIDIRDLDPAWLRGRAIGFINQEPTLFATTVMENIRYGRPDASDEEVIEVAKLANVDEFIRKFPNGYNTLVGEKGASVSGGQKQRIAIARALLKNPSILILDEATSALDAESEKVVQDALEKVARGRTVLVIAHRLSTIRNADEIVVLSNGVIVEKGTHDTLTMRKGFYWNLIRQQQMDEAFSRGSA